MVRLESSAGDPARIMGLHFEAMWTPSAEFKPTSNMKILAFREVTGHMNGLKGSKPLPPGHGSSPNKGMAVGRRECLEQQNSGATPAKCTHTGSNPRVLG